MAKKSKVVESAPVEGAPVSETPVADAPKEKKPRAAAMPAVARFYVEDAAGRKFPTSRRRDDRLKGKPDGKVIVDGVETDAWRSGSKVATGGGADARASYVWFRARGATVFVTSNLGEVLPFGMVLTTKDGAGPDGPPKASGKPRDSGWPEPKVAKEKPAETPAA